MLELQHGDASKKPRGASTTARVLRIGHGERSIVWRCHLRASKARRQCDLLRRDETGNERKIQAHRAQNSIAEESSMDIRVDSGGTCILRLDRSRRQRRWKIRSE